MIISIADVISFRCGGNGIRPPRNAANWFAGLAVYLLHTYAAMVAALPAIVRLGASITACIIRVTCLGRTSLERARPRRGDRPASKNAYENFFRWLWPKCCRAHFMWRQDRCGHRQSLLIHLLAERVNGHAVNGLNLWPLH